MNPSTTLIFALALALCGRLTYGAILSGSEGPMKVKSKSEMQTSFTLDENGLLTARTRTWTTDKFRGFTGGVFIAFMDETEKFIWNSEQHQYGVNGKWIPGKSDRTETWTEQVPTSILPEIRTYIINHQHTPTGRVLTWINEHKGEILTAAKMIISSGK